MRDVLAWGPCIAETEASSVMSLVTHFPITNFGRGSNVRKKQHHWPESHNVQVVLQTSSAAPRPRRGRNGPQPLLLCVPSFFGGRFCQHCEAGDRSGWQAVIGTELHGVRRVSERGTKRGNNSVQEKRRSPPSPLISTDHDNHGCYWCAVTLTWGKCMLYPVTVCRLQKGCAIHLHLIKKAKWTSAVSKIQLVYFLVKAKYVKMSNLRVLSYVKLQISSDQQTSFSA